MSDDIRIPSVGESVSSGLITQWHKNNGDTVNVGDLLLTLDTDKISTEITADSSGTLQILASEGEEVSIGSVVGRITTGDLSQSASSTEVQPTLARDSSNEDDGNHEETDPISFTERQESRDNHRQDIPVEAGNIASDPETPKNIKRDLRLDRKAPVSPVVNRLAKENGVDLSMITGSGKKGSILKKDVKSYMLIP